jgi:sialate O-acetylesterase
MKQTISRKCLFAGFLITVSGLVLPVQAEVKLAGIFGDNMVLQREMPINVWGTADVGEKVTVKLSEKVASATADEVGNWKVVLPALKAGKSMQLIVTGKNTITLSNIVMGEVWLCTGPNDMENGLKNTKNGQQEIASANIPDIRLFRVSKNSYVLPVGDLLPPAGDRGIWMPCSPTTVPNFSAIAYYFGRDLHQKLSVPVGLIMDTVAGDGVIESFTPSAALQKASVSKSIDQGASAQVQHYRRTIEELEAFMPVARKALVEGKPLSAFPILRDPVGFQAHQPFGMYNGMIHPLAPFAIRGALWSAGGACRHDRAGELKKMDLLISGWRTTWGAESTAGSEPAFSFYYIQTPCAQCDAKSQTAGKGADDASLVTMEPGSESNYSLKAHRLSQRALDKTYGQK